MDYVAVAKKFIARRQRTISYETYELHEIALASTLVREALEIGSRIRTKFEIKVNLNSQAETYLVTRTLPKPLEEC